MAGVYSFSTRLYMQNKKSYITSVMAALVIIIVVIIIPALHGGG